MCAAYISAGLPPDRFWDLTPRLYMLEMKGAAKRIERDSRSALEAAWLGAKLQRAAKIPTLEKLLPPNKSRGRRQSRAELQAMFDAMAAQMKATMQ